MMLKNLLSNLGIHICVWTGLHVDNHPHRTGVLEIKSKRLFFRFGMLGDTWILQALLSERTFPCSKSLGDFMQGLQQF